MSESNPDLDLGQEKKSGGMKNILMMAVGGVLLVGIGVGVAVMLMSGDDAPAEAEAEMAEEQMEEEAVEETMELPAIYEPLEPQFVVNFAHDGVLRYLQVSVSVMTRDEDIVQQVRHHMPAIRHEVVALLSSRTYEQLGSVEGKDELRGMIRDKIQEIVSPKGKGVEEIFLTGFVMQ